MTSQVSVWRTQCALIPKLGLLKAELGLIPFLFMAELSANVIVKPGMLADSLQSEVWDVSAWFIPTDLQEGSGQSCIPVLSS